MSQPDDEPAFPCDMPGPAHGKAGPSRIYYPGMTLRDYFAAQVLAGIFNEGKGVYESEKFIAEACYEMADAMLAERAK